MDDWNERTDLGVVNEWEKKTEMERIALWFSAFTPSSAKVEFVPEFAQFRDLVFQTKLVMDDEVLLSHKRAIFFLNIKKIGNFQNTH